MRVLIAIVFACLSCVAHAASCLSVDRFLAEIARTSLVHERLTGRAVLLAAEIYESVPPEGPMLPGATAVYLIQDPASGVAGLFFERGSAVCENILIRPDIAPGVVATIRGVKI